MEYLFVLANVIYIIGFVLIFQGIMNLFINKEVVKETIQKVHTKFFVRVAIFEMVPIFIMIIAFILMEGKVIDPTIPLIIIVTIFLIGIFRIFVSFQNAKGNVTEGHLTSSLQTLFFIAIPLLVAIPMISIVFLLILGSSAY